MFEELSADVKRAIVNQEIQGLSQAIYQQTIRHVVCEKVKDEKGAEACKKLLEQLVGRKMAYEEELKAIA